MARFRYRGFAANGQVLRGEADYPTAADLIRTLHAAGSFPVDVEPVTASRLLRLLQTDLFGERRASRQQVIVFTQQLSSLLGAGLPMDRTFGILSQSYAGSRLAGPVNAVTERLRNGGSLSSALAEHPRLFAADYTNLVQAGEEAGATAVVLARLAELLTRQQQLRSTIVSALVYPAILLVMAALSVIFVLTAVVPQFKPMLADAHVELSWSARILLGSSDVVLDNGLVLLAVFAAGCVGILACWQQPVVTLWRDGLVLRLPVLSNLVRTIEAARFCRTLATLLQNRVPMVRAARIVIDTLRNRAVVARLEPIIGQVKEGEGLALPLERAGILPSVAMQLVRVGEETGQLPEILGRAADMFERDVQRSTERLMTLLVPLLTIGLGAFIGGVVATIFSMLLSFNELAR